MERLITACSACIMRREDTPRDRWMKRTLAPIAALIMLFCTWVILGSSLNGETYYPIAVAFVQMAMLLFYVGSLLGANLAKLIPTLLVLAVIGVLAIDLSNASGLVYASNWSWVVVVLDAALVFELDIVPPIAIGLTAFYFVAERTEAALRLGLYDIPNADVSTKCDCADPPCALGIPVGFVGLATMLGALLADYYMTRSFACDLRLQLIRMRTSVDVAGEIAAALAGYDVDAADKAIERAENLPEELVTSYLQLLSNLRSYRDYLPESLLPDDSSSTLEGAVPAPVNPGGGSTNVGIVFTDIQSSTKLWESSPQGMYEALQIHNTALRAVAREHQGYEVKVIGDAMMLAFAKALDAIKFGAEAQLRLLLSEWPSALCDHPLCRRVEGPQGVPLLQGLRVRIGINWGPAQAELNPVNS
eukprot:Hpha_TRINITY_DN16030_c1_g4::TRINITY_DN16030_c1_g4_i1::g.120787::m.120787